MSNSSLVVYRAISPNCTKPRRGKIKHIVIHHMAGNLSVETCGQVFAPTSRQASSHYGIGSDGRIAQYCYEENRAWTTGHQIDHESVTIEVADDKIGAPWHSSDKAMKSLYKLVADICRRNGITNCTYTGDGNGTLLKHCWYQSTDCPGQWLGSMFPTIAKEANNLLNPTGWIQDKVGWWYKLADGTYYRSSWQKIKNVWYYFDKAGYALQNSWLDYKDNKYYLTEDCSMAVGWKKIGKDWYYFDSVNGDMKTDKLVEYKGKFYALGSDGKMIADSDITLHCDAEGVIEWKQ